MTSQFVRVTDDTPVWSERYDRVIDDMFSVQSEVAEQVFSTVSFVDILRILKPDLTRIAEKASYQE